MSERLTPVGSQTSEGGIKKRYVESGRFAFRLSSRLILDIADPRGKGFLNSLRLFRNDSSLGMLAYRASPTQSCLYPNLRAEAR